MTLRDDLPINACGVAGCPAIGTWPQGEKCPLHRDPFAQPERSSQ